MSNSQRNLIFKNTFKSVIWPIIGFIIVIAVLIYSKEFDGLIIGFMALVFILLCVLCVSIQTIEEMAGSLSQIRRYLNGEQNAGIPFKTFDLLQSPNNHSTLHQVSDCALELLSVDAVLHETKTWKRVILDHAPAFFTGLGILFTFVGLIKGISGLDLSGSSVVIQQSMNQLLQNVGVAFGSSLGGITMSLLTVFSTRITMKSLEDEVFKLRQYLEREHFKESSPEVLMQELTASSVHSKNTLLRLESSSKEQEAKLGALASDLGTALEKHLAGPLQQISTGLDNLAQGQASAHREAMHGVMDEFMKGFDDRLGAQLRGLESIFEQTLEWHRTAHESFAKTAEHLQTISLEQKQALIKQVELIEAQMSVDQRRALATQEHIEAMAKQGESFSSLVHAMEQHKSEWYTLSSNLTGALELLTESLDTVDDNNSAQLQILKDIEQSAVAWRGELELNASRYKSLSLELRESLHAGLGESFKSFDRESAKVADHLSGTYLTLGDTLKEMTRAMQMVEQHAQRIVAAKPDSPTIPFNVPVAR